MTTTDAPANTLTADDLAALRMADTVSLHYYEGRGYMRTSLQGSYSDGPRIYSAREQRVFPLTGDNVGSGERARDIEVGTGMFGYGTDDAGTGGWNLANESNAKASAFHMVSSATHNRRWCSIAALLRAGDALTLLWVADNNTGYINEVGYHADSVSLVIRRTKGEPLELYVGNYLGPDNSARMIKRYGY